MRTRPAHILPSCPWCEADHDPAIECRFRPDSVRFHLNEPRPTRTVIHRVTDPAGRVIAIRTTKETS
jgi:hypothetical protein